MIKLGFFTSVSLIAVSCALPAMSAPRFIETREPVEVVNPKNPLRQSIDLSTPETPKPIAGVGIPQKTPSATTTTPQVPSGFVQQVGLFVQPITLTPEEAKRGLDEAAFIKKARIAFARTDINKDGILSDKDKPKAPAGFTAPIPPKIAVPSENKPSAANTLTTPKTSGSNKFTPQAAPVITPPPAPSIPKIPPITPPSPVTSPSSSKSQVHDGS